MATRTKMVATKKITERNRKMISFLIVFVIVAFLLSFKKGAEILSQGLAMVGIDAPVDMIQDVAQGLFFTGTGGLLVYSASAFAGVAFVGVGLVVLGAGAIAYGAYKLFFQKKGISPGESSLNKM